MPIYLIFIITLRTLDDRVLEVHDLITGFVIALREGLEAALIVGIVLAFLSKTGERQRFKQVYVGITAAVITSVAFAFVFGWIAGEFGGQGAEIFEGVTTLVAAGLLTTMIIWMERRGPTLQQEMEKRAASAISMQTLGVFFIVFIAILREGVETVLFLTAIPSESADILLGAILGFGVAIVLAYIYFIQTKRFSLKTFFRATSMLLIIFAAGMVAYGIHELQEASVLPTVVEYVWDINFILDENSPFGQILKGLVGYNGNPSLLEVTAYISFITGIVVFYTMRHRMHKRSLES